MKPTPFFVAALVGLILIMTTMWIIATLHNNAVNQAADRILNPPVCRTIGNKQVPCPTEDEK